MKTAWRLLKPILIYGSILILVSLSGVAIINTDVFDENLSPELKTFLATANKASDDENAYLNILGLDASSERDPHTVGLKVVDLYHQKSISDQPIQLSIDEHKDLYGETGLDESWQATYSELSCHARRKYDCFMRLVRQVQDKPITQQRLLLMIQRYEDTLLKTQFAESLEVDLSTPIPPYGLMVNLGRLKLAHSYVNDDTSIFLQNLSANMQFWRNVLRNGQTLITKMIGIISIRNNLLALSGFISQNELSQTQLDQIKSLSRSLSKDELDIREAMLGELSFASSYLADYSGGIKSLFVQENASKNQYFELKVLPVLARSAISAKELKVSQKDFANQHSTEIDLSFPSILYNPISKTLLSLSNTQAYDDYIGRVHDLDGMFTLIALQLQLKMQSKLPAQSVIQNSKFKNPYTGQPMDFDANNGLLGFECFNPADVCQIFIQRSITEPAD